MKFMRVKFTILFLLAVLNIDVFAQGVSFGITMGVNSSYLIGKDKIEGSKNRLGICPGMFLDIPLVYESFLEIGAIYSQQGVCVKTEPDAPNNVVVKYTELRKIDYLTVPITWKQKFGDFFTQAGPFVSIATNAELTWKKDSILNQSAVKEGEQSSYRFEGKKGSFVNNLRQYDVGAMFGIGLQTAITGGMDLFFGASYKIGFFSVETKGKNESRNKILRNQVFSATAGIYFVKSRASRTYRGHSRRR
ncbi:MAG: hypothetical protein II937_06080 [Bacteroidales bacterium]|nr:hypothetical protein [Bacteroidales bacterium]